MRGNKLHRALDARAGQALIILLSPFSRRGAEEPVAAERRFRKILVVKLAALGDTILLVPALRALRERHPGAEIGMVGTEINREVVGELGRYVDRFFCLEPGRAVRDPRYLLRFVREVRAGGWEVAIDFDQWPHLPPLLLRLAGIPLRVGFRTAASRVRHRLYTHTRPREPDAHEAENFLRLLEPLGIAPPEPVLELSVRPEAAARRREALVGAGWNGRDPLVAVHPGCGAHGSPRAWPLPRFRELCERLSGEGGERPFFVFTGAGGEGPAAAELAASFPGRSLAVVDVSLADFVACLSLASLVVSGNTGAMHVAAALGVPQVALHGPTNARKWGPINPRAVTVLTSCPGCPCLDMGWEFHRTDGFCMEQISVDEVLAASRAALGTAPLPAAAG